MYWCSGPGLAQFHPWDLIVILRCTFLKQMFIQRHQRAQYPLFYLQGITTTMQSLRESVFLLS